jgi:hypothetical protein
MTGNELLGFLERLNDHEKELPIKFYDPVNARCQEINGAFLTASYIGVAEDDFFLSGGDYRG